MAFLAAGDGLAWPSQALKAIHGSELFNGTYPNLAPMEAARPGPRKEPLGSSCQAIPLTP
jgi:hypothetical protein